MDGSRRRANAAACEEAVAEALSAGGTEVEAHREGSAAVAALVSPPTSSEAAMAEAEAREATGAWAVPDVAASDRRRIRRHAGTGLVALAGGSEVEVLDISLAGMRLPRGADVGRGEVRIRVFRRRRRGGGAVAPAMVVARDGRGLHLKFIGMNYPLAQLIIEHVARVSGVSPYIFR